MDDLIRRHAAIDALADYIHNVDRVIGTGHLSVDDCKDAAISVLADLPSADRPIGEWVDNGDRYYRCSLCGTRDTDTWDWCHGCGCRMKGADGKE